MFTNLAIERGHQPCSENDDHSDNRILGILWEKTWGGLPLPSTKMVGSRGRRIQTSKLRS